MTTKKKAEAAAPQFEGPVWELFGEADYTGNEEWTALNRSRCNLRVYRVTGADQVFLGRHTGEEVPDEAALKALYQGGKFHLVAAHSEGKETGRVARRRNLTLPGEPALASTPQASPPATAASGRSAAELAVAFATIVMPPLFAYLQHSATVAQQDRATEATKAQEQHKALLEQQKAAFESLTVAMKQVAPTAPAPSDAGNAVGTIKEVAELMKELGFKREESDGLEKMLEAFMPMIAMKFMGGGGMPMPPMPAPAAARLN